MARLRRRHRVVGHRSRVRPVSSRNDLDLQPLAPVLDLLDGRRAERVARRQQRRLPARLHQVRQLGRGRGLARPVHAHNRNHRQPLGRFAQFGLVRCQALFHLAPRDGEHIQPRAALGFVGLLDRADDLAGHRHAQVGGDQRSLQLLQPRGVQFGRPGDDAFDLVRQLAVRLLQAGLELGE